MEGMRRGNAPLPDEDQQEREEHERHDRAAMSLINTNLAEPVNAAVAAKIVPDDPGDHKRTEHGSDTDTDTDEGT